MTTGLQSGVKKSIGPLSWGGGEVEEGFGRAECCLEALSGASAALAFTH